MKIKTHIKSSAFLSFDVILWSGKSDPCSFPRVAAKDTTTTNQKKNYIHMHTLSHTYAHRNCDRIMAINEKKFFIFMLYRRRHTTRQSTMYWITINDAFASPFSYNKFFLFFSFLVMSIWKMIFLHFLFLHYWITNMENLHIKINQNWKMIQYQRGNTTTLFSFFVFQFVMFRCNSLSFFPFLVRFNTSTWVDNK